MKGLDIIANVPIAVVYSLIIWYGCDIWKWRTNAHAGVCYSELFNEWFVYLLQ